MFLALVGWLFLFLIMPRFIQSPYWQVFSKYIMFLTLVQNSADGILLSKEKASAEHIDSLTGWVNFSCHRINMAGKGRAKRICSAIQDTLQINMSLCAHLESKEVAFPKVTHPVVSTGMPSSASEVLVHPRSPVKSIDHMFTTCHKELWQHLCTFWIPDTYDLNNAEQSLALQSWSCQEPHFLLHSQGGHAEKCTSTNKKNPSRFLR